MSEMSAGSGTATERWAAALGAWAIPEEILAAAPEPPWGFPPGLFRPDPKVGPAETPSLVRAAEALGERGEVLDVGVGGGAGSLPLAPLARRITGVDESEEMLTSFAHAAERAGVGHATILGAWPEVEAAAPVARVVTCFHVVYNVPNLIPFVRALTTHAQRRVVVELHERHPQTPLNDLWRHFWGVERPEGPHVSDAAAVCAEAGIAAHIESFERTGSTGRRREDVVAFVRRRLCLPAEHDPEIDALLPRDHGFPPRRTATLWWDV